jgi:glycosyltransferase involved in cell wall biosynthesis
VTRGRPPSVLILDQNLPVPFDRRVWRESVSLRAAGYEVTVVCPRNMEFPAAEEIIDGVRILRYWPGPEGDSLVGYIREYAVALFSMTRLSWRAARRARIDVVQACNPPDLLFLIALPLMLVRGAKFLFDHHDVSPELLVAKGYAEHGLVVRLSYLLERLTFGCAVVSMATNESYREIATRRGGMDPRDVFVVRSGPDEHHFVRRPADPRLKRGRNFLVGYVGIMGVQEGLDYLLDAAANIVHQQGRKDVQFALAGNGTQRERLVERTRQLRLEEYVEFLGRISDDELLILLSTADVCVNPDEANPMNDISTMHKVMEYMAMGKPMVQFDLREGRVSAEGASLYATPNDAGSLATHIVRLLDDPELRSTMGRLGEERFRQALSWRHQEPSLLRAYERAFAKSRRDIRLLRRSWWRKGRGRRSRVLAPGGADG